MPSARAALQAATTAEGFAAACNQLRSVCIAQRGPAVPADFPATISSCVTTLPGFLSAYHANKAAAGAALSALEAVAHCLQRLHLPVPVEFKELPQGLLQILPHFAGEETKLAALLQLLLSACPVQEDFSAMAVLGAVEGAPMAALLALLDKHVTVGKAFTSPLPLQICLVVCGMLQGSDRKKLDFEQAGGVAWLQKSLQAALAEEEKAAGERATAGGGSAPAAGGAGARAAAAAPLIPPSGREALGLLHDLLHAFTFEGFLPSLAALADSGLLLTMCKLFFVLVEGQPVPVAAAAAASSSSSSSSASSPASSAAAASPAPPSASPLPLKEVMQLMTLIGTACENNDKSRALIAEQASSFFWPALASLMRKGLLVPPIQGTASFTVAMACTGNAVNAASFLAQGGPELLLHGLRFFQGNLRGQSGYIMAVAAVAEQAELAALTALASATVEPIAAVLTTVPMAVPQLAIVVRTCLEALQQLSRDPAAAAVIAGSVCRPGKLVEVLQAHGDKDLLLEEALRLLGRLLQQEESIKTVMEGHAALLPALLQVLGGGKCSDPACVGHASEAGHAVEGHGPAGAAVEVEQSPFQEAHTIVEGHHAHALAASSIASASTALEGHSHGADSFTASGDSGTGSDADGHQHHHQHQQRVMGHSLLELLVSAFADMLTSPMEEGGHAAGAGISGTTAAARAVFLAAGGKAALSTAVSKLLEILPLVSFGEGAAAQEAKAQAKVRRLKEAGLLL